MATIDKTEKRRRRRLALEKLAAMLGKDISTMSVESDSESEEEELTLRKRILMVTNTPSMPKKIIETFDEKYWESLAKTNNCNSQTVP